MEILDYKPPERRGPRCHRLERKIKLAGIVSRWLATMYVYGLTALDVLGWQQMIVVRYHVRRNGESVDFAVITQARLVLRTMKVWRSGDKERLNRMVHGPDSTVQGLDDWKLVSISFEVMRFSYPSQILST